MRLAYYLEDDLDTQWATQSLLEMELPTDYKIESFRSLSPMREAIAQAKPNLVISDLNVLDAGPDAIIEVLNKELPAEVPVIVASGDSEALERVEKMPRFVVFPKGSDVNKFLEMVARHV